MTGKRRWSRSVVVGRLIRLPWQGRMNADGVGRWWLHAGSTAQKGNKRCLIRITHSQQAAPTPKQQELSDKFPEISGESKDGLREQLFDKGQYRRRNEQG
jgi:hypothetical protein